MENTIFYKYFFKKNSLFSILPCSRVSIREVFMYTCVCVHVCMCTRVCVCVCVCVGWRAHKDGFLKKYKSVCTVIGSKCVFQGWQLLEKYVELHCFRCLSKDTGVLAFCCLEVCVVK